MIFFKKSCILFALFRKNFVTLRNNSINMKTEIKTDTSNGTAINSVDSYFPCYVGGGKIVYNNDDDDKLYLKKIQLAKKHPHSGMTNLVYLKNQNGIWFDFKIEPMDDEILLEKEVSELSEDEAHFIVYLAEKHYNGDFDEEIQFLMDKYESVMDCFEYNIDYEFGEMNGFAEYIEPLCLDLDTITAEKLYKDNNQ